MAIFNSYFDITRGYITGDLSHPNIHWPWAEAVVSAAGATAAKIAVLTASDRAAGGVYEDKSGPAVVEMLKLFSDPWS